MEVYVVSRAKFDIILRDSNITDENVEKYKDTFFISILNTLSVPNMNFDEPAFKDPHDNVITLDFDDVIDDNYQAVYLTGNPDDPIEYRTGKAITDKQAEELVEFIKRNISEESTVLIHCAAGISRSGAVGLFISELAGNDYNHFIKINPMVQENMHVYRLLKQKYDESNEGH